MHPGGLLTRSTNSAQAVRMQVKPFFMGVQNVKENSNPNPDYDEQCWAEYARRKYEWVKNNPRSTPAQYDAMIRALLHELGL